MTKCKRFVIPYAEERGLAKIIRYTPIKDDEGRFLPLCDYNKHRGIVSKYYYRKCLTGSVTGHKHHKNYEKKYEGFPCVHYKRARIDESCRLNGRNGCKH